MENLVRVSDGERSFSYSLVRGLPRDFQCYMRLSLTDNRARHSQNLTLKVCPRIGLSGIFSRPPSDRSSPLCSCTTSNYYTALGTAGCHRATRRTPPTPDNAALYGPMSFSNLTRKQKVSLNVKCLPVFQVCKPLVAKLLNPPI